MAQSHIAERAGAFLIPGIASLHASATRALRLAAISLFAIFWCGAAQALLPNLLRARLGMPRCGP
jgi:hypothetical protein